MPQTLAQLKASSPAYAQMSDLEFASKVYHKHYADKMSFPEFAAKVGFDPYGDAVPHDPGEDGGTLSIGPLDTGISTPPWLDREIASFGRGSMLGARSTLEGAAAIPDFVGAPLRWGIEKVTGIPQTKFGDMATAAADRMGLPTPATPRERVVDDVGRAISGTAATMGVGGALPAGSRLAGMLTAQPKIQALSAATGATAGGVARENGGSPTSQFLATLLGGFAPGGATSATSGLAKMMFRGGEQGRKAVEQAIDDFASIGATPSIGQATGNWRTQGMESLLSGGPTSAGAMVRFAEGQADAMGAGMGRQADLLSRRSSAENAGRAIERGVREEGGFIDSSRQVANQLYQRLDEQIPKGTRVPVENTRAALRDLNSLIEGAPSVSRFFQNARLAGIEQGLLSDVDGAAAVLTQPGVRERVEGFRNALQQQRANTIARNEQRRALNMTNLEPVMSEADIDANVQAALGRMVDNNLPYEALQKLRTLVGSEIESASLMSDVPRSKWKALYGALSRDMEAAATTPGAKQALARANAYFNARVKRIDAIDAVIQKHGGPEKVFNAVMAGTRDGGTTLRSVMQSLDKEGQKAVTAAVIKRMGLATPGNQGAAGETFSAGTFLTNWNRISPEARRALFDRYGPAFSENMDKIARVAERIKTGSRVYANPAGTSHKAAAYTYWTGLAGSLAALPLTGPVPLIIMVSGGLTSRALASFFTNPKAVAWLSRNASKPAGSAMAELSLLAQSDPELAEIEASLRESTRGGQRPPQGPQRQSRLAR